MLDYLVYSDFTVFPTFHPAPNVVLIIDYRSGIFGSSAFVYSSFVFSQGLTWIWATLDRGSTSPPCNKGESRSPSTVFNPQYFLVLTAYYGFMYNVCTKKTLGLYIGKWLWSSKILNFELCFSLSACLTLLAYFLYVWFFVTSLEIDEACVCFTRLRTDRGNISAQIDNMH